MAGMAFAFKRRATGQVALNFFGDGAVNKGDWHEAMNLASLWALLLSFFCEKQPVRRLDPHQRRDTERAIVRRAAAYRMPGSWDSATTS